MARAEKAGCTAIVFTVDSPGARNRRDAEARHACRQPRLLGLPHARVAPACGNARRCSQASTCRVSPRSRPPSRHRCTSTTALHREGPLLIKGIVTGEDAAIALKNGADGMVVSNHGGRNEETLRASVDCLPEVSRPFADVCRCCSMAASDVALMCSRRWRLVRRGWHRPAAGLGPGGVRSDGSRGRFEHSRYRVDRHHAAGGYADHRDDRPRSCGARVTRTEASDSHTRCLRQRSPSLATRLPPRLRTFTQRPSETVWSLCRRPGQPRGSTPHKIMGAH